MQVGSHDLATRLSIGPWHLGISSALMRLFDLFVHTEDPFGEDKALDLKSSGMYFQAAFAFSALLVIRCYKVIRPL